MRKKLIISFMFLFLITGCGLETYQSGDLPSQQRLNMIQAGFDRAKVVDLLGEPTFENKVGRSQFFVYSRIRKQNRAFLPPQETERDLYVISFDPYQRVNAVRHLTLDDANQISYDETITKVTGKELTVMEQLVKNFGRYDAGGRDSTVRQ